MTNRHGSTNDDTHPGSVAAQGGRPPDDDVENALHEIRDGILGQSGVTQPGSARDAYDDVRGAAQATSRHVFNEASDLADQARATADEVRGRVRDTYDDFRDRAAGAYDDARSWAADRYEVQRHRASEFADRGYERVNHGRAAIGDFATDNPLIVGVVGLAAGLLLGALLPRTRREDQTLGPWASEARDQGLRYAREATVQGRQFVERALDPDNLETALKGERGGHEPHDDAVRNAQRP